MTSLDFTASGGSLAMRLALPVFAAALFLSAFLLFSVQPMFAKLVLPILGGAPSVWSVAMVFFQAVLLAGYAYAHALSRLRSTRLAAGLHLALMGAAFLVLPVALAPMAQTPPEQGEALWLIGVFALSVGLPFFAVSANGPLLQAWFARSGHHQARDPYFLYGASNIGSFAALIAYPLAIEPLLTLGAQSRGWSAGFALLGVAIAACAAVAASAGGDAGMRADARSAADAPAPTLGRRFAWIALAAVPSGLLVSVTAHISTNVAAAPLLWVAPLALFLATFVLVFRERPLVSDATLSAAQIVFVGAAAAQFVMGSNGFWPTLVIHLGLFFVSAMACHSALYARRPQAARLTEFYMLMSLGGVVGGVFCGLLAPHLFSTVVEYPLLIVAALFCSAPALAAFAGGAPDGPLLPQGRAGQAGVLAGALAIVATQFLAPQSAAGLGLVAFGAFALCLRAPRRAALLALAAGLVAAVSFAAFSPARSYRSFFGVHKIAELFGEYRVLLHGTTAHGGIRIKDASGAPVTGDPQPLTYYTDAGPIAEAVRAARAARGGHLSRTSLVGLGAGALACQMRRDEPFAFFEIDPVVVKIASDPALFRYLDVCGKDRPIILGDARLTLAKAPAGAQLLVVDAFSSDAIPTHLLTKEAFAVYLRHLDARGVVVLHVSNNYLDLTRVVARTAGELGLRAWMRFDPTTGEEFRSSLRSSAQVVVLAREADHVGPIASGDRWTPLDAKQNVAPWTDDYSNVLQAMADKFAPPKRE
jgi:spermidine synthase